MKKKKSFQPDTMMKRLNWTQLKTNVIKENSFWVEADEEKFESHDLFTRLMATFGQKKSKKLNVEIDKPQKKVKDLKVLDTKSAQNLCKFSVCFYRNIEAEMIFGNLANEWLWPMPSSVARGGGEGAIAPLHWPVNQTAD